MKYDVSEGSLDKKENRLPERLLRPALDIARFFLGLGLIGTSLWQRFQNIRIERLSRPGLIFLCVVLTLGAVGPSLWYFKELVYFYPANGHFQNFNTLWRLSEGYWPGSEVNVYLGFGPVLSALPLYLLAGGGLGVATFANALIHYVIFVLSAALLFRLLGVNKLIALTGGMFTLFLINGGYVPKTDFTDALYILTVAESSMLGARSFWSFIVAAGLFFIEYRYPGQSFNRHADKWIGAVIGAGLLWSNDYGIAVFLMVFGLYGLTHLIKGGFGRAAVFGLKSSLCALIAYGLLLTLLTGGDPLSFLHYNYVGLASEQFWQFNIGSKIFYPLDAITHIGMVIAICVELILVWNLMKSDTSDRKYPYHLVITFLLGAAIGACLISWIGGSMQERYAANMYRVMPFATVFLITLFWSPRLPSSVWLRRSFPVLVSFFFAYWGYLSWTIATERLGYFIDNVNNPDHVMVEEVNARVPSYWQGSIDLAKEIGAEIDAAGGDRQSDYFSTYKTIMDYVIGARNPTPHDYIIHVMGHRAREDHFSAYKKANPLFVSTLNPVQIPWGGWNMRMRWDFYKDLNENYEPYRRTIHNLIWKRIDRNEPPSPSGAPSAPDLNELAANPTDPAAGLACETHINGSTIDILIDNQRPSLRHGAPQEIGNQGLTGGLPGELIGELIGEGESELAEIIVTVDRDINGGYLPIFSTRHYEMVGILRTGEVLGVGPGGHRRFGVILSDGAFTIPVRLAPGQNRLRLDMFPQDRVKVKTSSCEVRGVYQDKAYAFLKNQALARKGERSKVLFTDLPKSNIRSFVGGGNGIYDPVSILDAWPGDELVLANGATRKITHLDFYAFGLDGYMFDRSCLEDGRFGTLVRHGVFKDYYEQRVAIMDKVGSAENSAQIIASRTCDRMGQLLLD